jgi:hypothetical protein
LLCRKFRSQDRSSGRPSGQPSANGLGVYLAWSSLAGVPALLASCAISAANWEVAPRVEAGYRFNDNYYLDQPGSEIKVAGPEIDAAATFRTIDPRTQFEITPRIEASYFPGDEQVDSTDYFLRMRVDDETPRRDMGFLVDYSREDVASSELPGADLIGDLGDPTVVDSGRVVQRNRRNLVSLQPYFHYDLSQRYRLELDAHYLQADFDEQLAGAQQDFSEVGGAAGFGFQVSPRSSVTVRALASQYETTFETDAYGGDVEWATDFSESSRIYARVGAQQTRPERGEDDTSILAGVGGRWRSLRNALFVDLTRTVGPVAAGTIVERRQLRLRIDHDVSQHVALLLGARAFRDEQLGRSGTHPTRKYAVAEAGFEWRWSRSVSLAGTYSYWWQEYADLPSSAAANSVLLSLVYQPRRAD